MKRAHHKIGSPLHPLSLGLDAAAIAFLTLLINIAAVAPGGPGTQATALSLAPALCGLFVAQVVLALLRGPWPIRAVTLGVQAAGWYWLATLAAGRIATDRGLALFPDEAFTALFWRAPLTPILWALGSFGYLALQRFLERIFEDPARNPTAG